MIREHLFDKRAAADPLFRWRGGEVSRLEAFSDAVFALTLTLLIVSLSVPQTFYELWQTFRELPVFVVCFAVLMMAWQYHYSFFRRYGLQDFITIVLNAVFLFLVLFLAYPLKFLATFLWRLILGDGTEAMFILPAGHEFPGGSMAQRSWMLILYGLGLIGVFGMLASLLWRAWCKRGELELDALERHLTLTGIGHHLITVSVSAASVSMVLAGSPPGYAGCIYFTLGPLHGLYAWRRGLAAARLHHLTGTEKAGHP